MLIEKYINYKIYSKYSTRDEEVSLAELEKLDRVWVASLVMMHGSCVNGEGLSTTNRMLSSLLLANMGIPSLASLLLSHHCSSCELIQCPVVSTL